MYSIGEVSEMFHLPIPTIRFYDKEGLLLDLKRDPSGIRKFDEKNLESLRLIECLKKSGMKIKDIKEFMHWCSLGDETIEIRKEMFLKQKENIEKEMQELQNALDMIKYKCWYYDQALKDGTEKYVKNKAVCDMPEEIKKFYTETHQS